VRVVTPPYPDHRQKRGPMRVYWIVAGAKLSQIVWSPLAQGLLTGKPLQPDEPPQYDERDGERTSTVG
jgi:aryl-alcohol dehydrogenase-like predicted oxidoreductase